MTFAKFLELMVELQAARCEADRLTAVVKAAATFFDTVDWDYPDPEKIVVVQDALQRLKEGTMTPMGPTDPDIVTLLKMAAEHVLAGDALSADRDVASIHVAAATMVEVADALTVAEQTIARLTTERDEALENWSREAAERDVYRADLAAVRAVLGKFFLGVGLETRHDAFGTHHYLQVQPKDFQEAHVLLSRLGTGEKTP